MTSRDSALLPVYRPLPVGFVRGEGVWLYDEHDQPYLDFAGGLAVSALGHGHPHLLGALKNQAEQVWHVSNLFTNPQQEKLARRLCDASGLDKVFFANSGAEAVEGAIKIARHWHLHHGRHEKTDILAFSGSFHGRTLAGIAASARGEAFAPVMPGFHHVPFGDRQAVEKALTPNLGAILAEPIQGEGGIIMPPSGWLKFLRDFCNKHGLLLILDEVQTGIGRCGHFFAYQAEEIEPDIIASAKGLGGGFPIGAILVGEKAAQGMEAGLHGSTFGGNPLACACADAVLDIVLEPGFLDQVRHLGGRMAQGLSALAAEHPNLIAEVRGTGLLWGIALHKPEARELTKTCLREGLLTAPAGDGVVRLLPPLIVDEGLLGQALARLNAACAAFGRET